MDTKSPNNLSSSLPEGPNIFTSMFSLLRPAQPAHQSRPMLLLPNVFGALESSEAEVDSDKPRRKRKKVTACPHFDKPHYAKNMCDNCYHKFGRSKNPWLCQHSDRPLYAKGKCQKCYLLGYHNRDSRSRSRDERGDLSN